MGRLRTILALASVCACGSTLAFTTGGGRPSSVSPLAKPGGRIAWTRLAGSSDGDDGKKETTLDRIFGPKLFKTVTN